MVPIHRGELLDKVGAAGAGMSVTTVVADVLLHPPTVTIKEYVPAAANVEFKMDGF